MNRDRVIVLSFSIELLSGLRIQIAQLFLADVGVLLELHVVSERLSLLLHNLSGLRQKLVLNFNRMLLLFCGKEASFEFVVDRNHLFLVGKVDYGLRHLVENALNSAPLNAVPADFFDDVDALEHIRYIVDAPLLHF